MFGTILVSAAAIVLALIGSVLLSPLDSGVTGGEIQPVDRSTHQHRLADNVAVDHRLCCLGRLLQRKAV